MISEVTKFVNAFGYPISQSVSHIYLSALPFSPPKICRSATYARGIPRHFISGNRTSEQVAGIDKYSQDTPRVCIVHSPPTALASYQGPLTDNSNMGYVSGMPSLNSGGCFGMVFSFHFLPMASTSSLGLHRGFKCGIQSQARRFVCHCKDVLSMFVSVAYSPDGCRIVSGSDDGTVRIWDAVSGASICGPLEGHSDAVMSVGILSRRHSNCLRVRGQDSSYVGCCVWHTHRQTTAGTLRRCQIGCVFFQQHTPISGSDDCTIRLWDATTSVPIGQPLRVTPT